MQTRRIGPEIKSLSNLIKRSFPEGEEFDGARQMTRMQGWIVGYLYLQETQGRAVCQRDVEREFNIRRSTASGILTLMEKNGLVVRRPSAEDGRMKQLELTDCARSFHARVRREADEMEERMRRNISLRDLETFFRVLEQIRGNLEPDGSEQEEAGNRT